MTIPRLSLTQVSSPLSIPLIVEELKLARGLQQCMTHVEHFPAQDARYAGFPEGLDPLVIEVFKKRGIEQLYTHQAEAVQKTLAGRNVVVVTPTASGKTLCYNIPVLNTEFSKAAATAHSSDGFLIRRSDSIVSRTCGSAASSNCCAPRNSHVILDRSSSWIQKPPGCRVELERLPFWSEWDVGLTLVLPLSSI